MRKTFIFFASLLLFISCDTGVNERKIRREEPQEHKEKTHEMPSGDVAQKVDKFDILRERMELNRYIIKMDIHFGYENQRKSYPVHNILLSNGEVLVAVDVRGYFIREKDFFVFKNGKLFNNIGSEK